MASKKSATAIPLLLRASKVLKLHIKPSAKVAAGKMRLTVNPEDLPKLQKLIEIVKLEEDLKKATFLMVKERHEAVVKEQSPPDAGELTGTAPASEKKVDDAGSGHD